jgi:hypothetical protein
MLNDKVNSNNRSNEDDLKETIQDTVSSISPVEPRRAMSDVFVTSDTCLQA